MIEILIYILAFLITFVGVRKFRQWILRKKIVDIPNERSSHKTPVARGGGLVIVLVCLGFYTFYTVLIAGNFSYAYFITAGFIAFVSWIDDLRSISFGTRFIVHSTAAFIIIWFRGGWEIIYLPFFGAVESGFFGDLLCFLWIVWLTNAYNFMDGIDGIAALQAIIAGIGWYWIGMYYGLPAISFLGGVTAFSGFGFILHNWQPAKIFMGDVGSAFFGYTFAVMPLLTNHGETTKTQYLPLIGIILVWLFVCDTILTLFLRIVSFEKIWEAHRKHIYQKLVISGLSHSMVTSIYGAISTFTVIILIFWIKSAYLYNFLLAMVLILTPLSLLFIFAKRKYIN